jgi:tetratricopeptide (TPR) repeat protein
MLEPLAAFVSRWAPLCALAVLSMAAFAGGRRAAAQEDGAAAVEKDERLESALEELSVGDYESAVESFRGLIDADAGLARARVGLARALEATGKYEEALEALRAAPDYERRAELLAAAAQVLLRTGQLKPAREALEKAMALDGRSSEIHYLLGRTLWGLGEIERAREVWTKAIDVYRQLDPDDAGKLGAEPFVYWGLCLIGLNRFKQAEEVMFSQAEEIDPKSPLLLYERGRMFQTKYNFPDSRSFYRDLLSVNRDHADAQAALADNYITDFLEGTKRFVLAEKAIERALKVNPRHAEAFRVRGRIWFYDGYLSKAIADLEKSLAENPADLRTRGLLAACHFVAGNREAYQAAEAEALAINPKASEFFYTVAVSIEPKFRYPDIVRMCDRALELDPEFWPAYDTLGINCLRTGEYERGRQFLDKSWEKDKYNVWVFNTRTLLRHMDENYTSFANDRFKYFLPKADVAAMRPYLEPLLDRAHEDLSKRYRLEIDRPIHIECFSEHKWFSARTVGLEGFAASGACFGKLVTLTTPKALPQNWGAVAWHEFAHVVTIQLTQYRIPRWLTEGISVYEEGRFNPSWSRNFQREIADAFGSGQLLPMAELDFGFSKPKFPMQVLLSYYQGCMIIEYIVGRWSFDAVLAILDGYREYKSTARIFRDVLGLELEEFDRGFFEHVKAWVEKNGYAPSIDESAIARLELARDQKPEDLRVLCDLAWAYLSNNSLADAAINAGKALALDAKSGDANAILGLCHVREKKPKLAKEKLQLARELGTRFAFHVHAALGDLLARDEDTHKQAIEAFEEAKKVSPIAGAGHPAGGPNIYYKLAKLYEEEKEDEKAIQQMEEVAKFSSEDPECRLRLVKYAMARQDHEKAARYLDELMFINPFEIELHRWRAQVAEELGDPDTVIRELQLALGHPRTNTLKAHLSLARAYHKKMDRQQAASEARKVLDIEPENEEAKKILEEATREKE